MLPTVRTKVALSPCCAVVGWLIEPPWSWWLGGYRYIYMAVGWGPWGLAARLTAGGLAGELGGPP
jgi:hypothetical protein